MKGLLWDGVGHSAHGVRLLVCALSAVVCSWAWSCGFYVVVFLALVTHAAGGFVNNERALTNARSLASSAFAFLLAGVYWSFC